LETSFTRLVGCRHPLQQAAMGGVATAGLAAAVARAGALGMLCEYDATPASERMSQALAAAGPDGRLGMGFFGQWLAGDLATFEEAAARLHVVEVFWSQPERAVVDRARGCGASVICWQVGSLDEASAAADAGCDFVVAQGVESGGHVRGSTPRERLLADALDAVDIPVLAAGGIATAADVAQAIGAGAAGVRVGTRFVASDESAAHPAYVAALVAAASGDETVLTTTFGLDWPDAPHRVLRSAVDAADAISDDVVGHVVQDGHRNPMYRYSSSPPTKETEGAIAAMALYAGTGVGAVIGTRPAADIVTELVSGIG
jgi:NAD(P)H-dependent flavin oxidoreductase YrpB (nitropropane dioxygenase family)